MSYDSLPIEMAIGGVYFPPLVFASILGAFMAWSVIYIMHRYDLIGFVWHPPLFYLSLVVICTCLIGVFLIPI